MANPNVRFEGSGAGEHAERVTASASAGDNKPTPWRAIRVDQTAGSVELLQPNGDTVIYHNVQIAERIVLRAVRVVTAGTTAVGFVAEW